MLDLSELDSESETDFDLEKLCTVETSIQTDENTIVEKAKSLENITYLLQFVDQTLSKLSLSESENQNLTDQLKSSEQVARSLREYTLAMKK